MFKTLVNQIGDYKRDTILTPVLVILEVIMEVIIPMMMAAIMLVSAMVMTFLIHPRFALIFWQSFFVWLWCLP